MRSGSPSPTSRTPVASSLILGLALLTGTGCGRTPEAPPPPAEHAHEAGREVRLSEDAVRAAGIELVRVSREAFHPHVVASGVIRPVAQRSVTVRSLVGGRIVDVGVDVGDRVAKGRMLATLEGSEVTAAQTRWRAAAAREAGARLALERGERLLDLKGISRAEVETRRAEAESASAEADGARQEMARLGLDPGDSGSTVRTGGAIPIVAPRSGIVLSRTVSPGLLVDREAPLFDIADLSEVWAIVDVYEKDLGGIRDQGDVEITSDTWPGVVFTGRIDRIEPTLDEAGRTAHVRVVLDNRSGAFRPGMFVTASVPLRGATDVEATAVPDAAVQMIAGLPAVFVAVGAGRFELRPIEVGRKAHGMVEIRHGVQDSEEVVSRGAFVLKSELLKGLIEGEDH